MAQQTINIGSVADDGTGDPLRTAFDKTNDNFTELYGLQITYGTGVAAALGVNIGSAGAPVLFNGAGGTPSSLTLTNATGLPITAGTTGTLGPTRGGTGLTTYTTGDLLYADASNSLAKLAAGTDGYVLTMASGVPSWAAASGGGGSPGGSDTQIQFNDGGSFGGDSAFTWDKTNNKLTLASGTLTTSQPAINITQTWNDGAVAFTALDVNVTKTASSASSKLIDLRIGGTSRFYVSSDDELFFANANNTYISVLNVGSNYLELKTEGGARTMGLISGHVRVRSGGGFGFSSDASNPFSSMDVRVNRVGAGILGVRDGSTGGAALSFVEQTAPSAPSADGVYIYAQDNGAGKTQLMALFSSGAAQQIAIQP